MREALEHLAFKTDSLEDELKKTKDLLMLHKTLLEEALSNQNAALAQCKESGS